MAGTNGDDFLSILAASFLKTSNAPDDEDQKRITFDLLSLLVDSAPATKRSTEPPPPSSDAAAAQQQQTSNKRQRTKTEEADGFGPTQTPDKPRAQRKYMRDAGGRFASTGAKRRASQKPKTTPSKTANTQQGRDSRGRFLTVAPVVVGNNAAPMVQEPAPPVPFVGNQLEMLAGPDLPQLQPADFGVPTLTAPLTTETGSESTTCFLDPPPDVPISDAFNFPAGLLEDLSGNLDSLDTFIDLDELDDVCRSP